MMQFRRANGLSSDSPPKEKQMKRCPTCQRTYPDDSPGFCVNDGAQLVSEEPQAYDPQKTMLASAPPPPPPAPPQYQAQNAPPEIKPPTQWQQPQAGWPPPPQGQNWGGYYQQPGQAPPGYAPNYGAPAPAGGKGLSLSSFIIGLLSFAAVVLIFLMAQRIVDPDRDVALICFWGSAGAGLVAIVLGLLALISRRQRKKWMAILGLVLGIPAIMFFAYVMIRYSSF
jgi:hypothetical protein